MNIRQLNRFGATAIALLLLKPLHVGAAEFADPAQIRALAEQTVRAAVGANGAQLLLNADELDARLRLAPCAAPLQAFIAGDGQLRDHTTVGVRCETGQRWALYLGVTVSSELPVLVAQRALPRDAAPTAADFSVVRRRLPGLSSNYLSDPALLTGQRLRRAVALGEALSADALLSAIVVQRGQELTLLAHASGMDVRVKVVALADGRPQERIRVQNTSSHHVIEATVRSAQLVEVSL